MQLHDHLPRLAPEFYRGFAMVHWTLTSENRETGWLYKLFHARFREILLHASSRYHLFCPVYCLMPDHLHMIWVGVQSESDQQTAMKFFKRYLHKPMSPQKLQKQSYDNILREKDREQHAFQSTCFYILENPVRAGLAKKSTDWNFSGTMVPGYPDTSPHETDFLDLFWRLYAARRERPTF